MRVHSDEEFESMTTGEMIAMSKYFGIIYSPLMTRENLLKDIKECEMRDFKYIEDLKKENSTLRKLIIKQEEASKELRDDINLLIKTCKVAATDAIGLLGMETTDENIEECVDEWMGAAIGENI